MKFSFVILILLLSLGGCRLSCTAEKLSFTIQVDEPGYLSTEDPALYEDSGPANSDPAE